MIVAEKNKNYLFGFFAVLFISCAALAGAMHEAWLLIIPFIPVFFYAGWQSIRVVFFLLLFLIPFSAEYQVSSSLATDFPDELLMLLVSVLFCYYWLYHPAALNRCIISHPLLVVLLLGFCWVVISSLFSTGGLLSVKFLLAKTWYFGAFILAPLIVFRDKKSVQRGLLLLVSAMIIVTVIALARHALYGFRFANINDALHPFFRNHVNYSAMLVCVIPAVFVYWQTGKTISHKWISGIVLAILLAALFFSYARGAWLALFTGMAAVWLTRKKLLVAGYVFVIMLMLLSLFWLKSNDRYLAYAPDYKTTVWHEDFGDHLTATYHFRDVSTAERFYRWIAGVRMIKDRWLTGYGPNTFYDNYRPYAIPAFKTWVSDNSEHSTVHNYFLLIAIEQGIPGLILFILLTACMLWYAEHLYHRVNDVFYRRVALLAGVVTIMILTVNFLSDLIETDKIGSLFFLCLSLLAITDINTRNANSAQT